jgi:hypothetical protein
LIIQKKAKLNLILNLAPISMKKTRIEITHQIEKTKHVFYVINPDKLNRFDAERIKKEMGVEMIFLNGKLYK